MTAPPADACAWLGIDVGTSAVKVALVDPEGRVLAAAEAPLSLRVPEPLAAEQDAAAWWAATVLAVRRTLAAAAGVRVDGVGLTGQKHALLVLDEGARPLAPAVLWADGRATAEVRRLARAVPDLARRTGAPALPGYLVPKWWRWRQTHPDLAGRAAHLVFAKDWIRWRLTGAWATDRTEASAAQLYDARRRTWSESLCRELDVPVRLLPPVRPSLAVSGRVTRAAAAETHLAAGTPVVAGAGDNEAGAVAAGAVVPGCVAVLLGTSGTVVATARRRRQVPGLVWGAHVRAREATATGVLLSAGRALTWVRDLAFGAGTPVEEVVAAAGRVTPGDAVPLFLPSLAGERSPVPDPEATGAFVGLRPHHGPPHVARAVLEGVALGIGQILDRLRAARVPVGEVRLLSGGAAEGPWRDLVAGAAGCPLRVVGGGEAGAVGAAMLAAASRGGDAALLELVARWVRPSPPVTAPSGEIERLREASRRLAALRDRLSRWRRAASGEG